jgi:hypothetical protein
MQVFKVFSFLVAAALVASCTSVKVVTDMDQAVDFSQYKTYSFLGWQNNSDQILNDFDKRRIRDAFISEFETRGMTYAEEGGDMDVSLFIVVDQKTTTTAYTNYYGGRYGGYYRYRGGWGYGYASTTYSESDYLEGTLVMDVFDGKSKKQIWQGIATSTVSENPDKREKTIPSKINALMNKFPVQPK